jgi:hypothetical protein
MMTLEEQIAVITAESEGKEIECRFRLRLRLGPPEEDKWKPKSKLHHEGEWRFSYFEYRVKEVPASINWDHVAPKFNALILGRSGCWFLTEHIPKEKQTDWFDRGDQRQANIFASFNPGTVTDWRKSLVVRPGYEETDQ